MRLPTSNLELRKALDLKGLIAGRRGVPRIWPWSSNRHRAFRGHGGLARMDVHRVGV
jgi:hypothetical protein